jgi:hypothetical protein
VRQGIKWCTGQVDRGRIGQGIKRGFRATTTTSTPNFDVWGGGTGQGGCCKEHILSNVSIVHVACVLHGQWGT